MNMFSKPGVTYIARLNSLTDILNFAALHQADIIVTATATLCKLCITSYVFGDLMTSCRSVFNPGQVVPACRRVGSYCSSTIGAFGHSAS